MKGNGIQTWVPASLPTYQPINDIIQRFKFKFDFVHNDFGMDQKFLPGRNYGCAVGCAINEPVSQKTSMLSLLLDIYPPDSLG